MPVLQELAAVGGGENVRFLYERLLPYFPQLSEAEIYDIKNKRTKSWKSIVQKTGRILEQNNLIRRVSGFWTVTQKGKSLVEAETHGFSVSEMKIDPLSHSDIQEMLIEIGVSLGFYAQAEFEYFDVVWRENAKNHRISHIFEVQSKGNIDSAFAKLKRAYEAQRTKPFLVVASEKDLTRARQSLVREFHDLEDKLTVFTFAQIQQVHHNLTSIAEIIKELLLK